MDDEREKDTEHPSPPTTEGDPGIGDQERPGVSNVVNDPPPLDD